MTIFTFGHSTLEGPAGAKLLRDNGIKLLIDVRSHPTSKWEQWRKENMEKTSPRKRGWLLKEGLKYEWWPELGGWDARHLPLAPKMECYGVDVPTYAKGKFPKQRIGKDKPGCGCGPLFGDKPSWTNQGLWDYQFFMTLPEFKDGLTRLMLFDGPDDHCAIMCCELLWWKCHRSMIADALAFFQMEAQHLQPKATPHFKALGNRLERYHPDVLATWERWKVEISSKSGG